MSNKVVFFFILNILILISSCISFKWVCNDQYCLGSDKKIKRINSRFYANYYCNKLDKKSFLLEIYDEKTQNLFNNFMKKNEDIFKYDIPLNLEREDGKWRWNDGTPLNEILTASPYKIKLFNDQTPFGTLKRIPFRGIFGTTYVTSKLNNYICSYQGPCTSNKSESDSFFFKGNCFVVFRSKNLKLSWFEAEKNCFTSGGSLAKLSSFSPEEIQFYFSKVTFDWENFWIGLVKSTWKWKNNPEAKSNYTNFYNGYPYPFTLYLNPRSVLNFINYWDGSIWKDFKMNPFAPIVCMKKNLNSKTTGFFSKVFLTLPFKKIKDTLTPTKASSTISPTTSTSLTITSTNNIVSSINNISLDHILNDEANSSKKIYSEIITSTFNYNLSNTITIDDINKDIITTLNIGDNKKKN